MGHEPPLVPLAVGDWRHDGFDRMELFADDDVLGLIHAETLMEAARFAASKTSVGDVRIVLDRFAILAGIHVVYDPTPLPGRPGSVLRIAVVGETTWLDIVAGRLGSKRGTRTRNSAAARKPTSG